MMKYATNPDDAHHDIELSDIIQIEGEKSYWVTASGREVDFNDRPTDEYVEVRQYEIMQVYKNGKLKIQDTEYPDSKNKTIEGTQAVLMQKCW